MTSGDTRGAAWTYITVVATIETIAHSEVLTITRQRRTEMVGTSMVIAVSAIHVPAVSTPVGGIEVGTSVEEIVAVGIAGIDAEMPIACIPVEKDVAQVEVTTLPVGTIHIVYAGDTHEVVEVDFVRCLVLGISQVELVGHLVGEEQGLVAGLLVAHG